MTANRYPKVTELARTFPCFALGGPKANLGVEPFDPVTFSIGLGGCSHGEFMAGMFVLSVFYGEDSWSFEDEDGTPATEGSRFAGSFRLHEALGVWDHEYRAAFIRWACAPWWP